MPKDKAPASEDGEESGDETSSAASSVIKRAYHARGTPDRARGRPSIAGATVHRATAVAGHRAQTSTASRESRLDARK